jgi:uncharacterized membrane protein
MHLLNVHYFPLSYPFLLILGALVVMAIALIEIEILGYAYEKMGINRRYVFTILVLSLLGSYVNIPVAELPPEDLLWDQEVPFYGMRYVVPPGEGTQSGTVVAVNVGGALIPVLLSGYLLMKKRLYVPALFGVMIVTAVTHFMAYPVRGVGIAVPIFIPPLAAAATALILARKSAPALAYIVGSLGTLLGADLLNLTKVAGLGAPVASIGGAGTFDGIFLTGILAVLLA